MPGLVRAGEVGPDPGDPDLAGLLGLTCGCGQGGPVDRGAPAAGEPGVDLELHPGSGSLLLGRTGDLAELVERGGGDVNVALDRGGLVLARDTEPAQDAAPVMAVTQRHRLVDGRHA